jgi:hypothetical protein
LGFGVARTTAGFLGAGRAAFARLTFPSTFDFLGAASAGAGISLAGSVCSTGAAEGTDSGSTLAMAFGASSSGCPAASPTPGLRLWRGRQRGGLIGLLIDFRRRREGGDKLDIHGFSLVLDAARRRQRDEHRQNQGKGGCVDEADANHPNRQLDLLGIDHRQARGEELKSFHSAHA